MTSNNLSAKDVLEKAETLDFPSSVVEFFQGYLGQPYGGFPEPLRSHVIRNKARIDARPGLSMAPLDFRKIKQELRSKFGKHITDVDVSSYCMYPKVFEEYQGFLEKYGDLRYVEHHMVYGAVEVDGFLSVFCLPVTSLDDLMLEKRCTSPSRKERCLLSG
jgi:pyruvate carboxylase